MYMPLPYLSENDFKDPIIFQKRDIAIPATDTNKKIVNNIVVLDEIPEYINHITIDGYYEVFNANTVLQANQFRTNYTLGILTFSPSQEGKTISQIKYNATGVIYTPATRIYTQLSEDGKTVEQTLQEMIDSISVYQYMGNYDNSVPYTVNQQVYYNGSTYIAVKNTTGNPPTTQEYWRLLGAGFVFKGDYDNTSTYYPRDVVYYDVEKSLYVCKGSTNPGVLPTDTVHWDKLVSFKSIYDTESARVAAENARAAAESGRIVAETDRTNAEIMRAGNETERVNAETSRLDAESDRINAENLRVSAENSRVTAEVNRASVETIRVDTENTRNSNETGRQANEANRQNEEAARASQENARVSAEADRETAEDNRASGESTRVTNEDIRTSNETSRQANETTRQNHDSAIQVWEPYDNSKAYAPLNKVEYLGSSYICKQVSTGNIPTNTVYWSLIASKGADGAGGDMFKSIYDPDSDGKVNSAESADSVPWKGVSSKPSTLSGYGITDAVKVAIVSDAEPTADLVEGMFWYNNSTDETKAYLNGAFRGVGGNSILTYIDTEFTATSDGTTHCLLNTSNFNPNEDLLQVTFNQLLLSLTTNYIINADNESIDLVGWSINTGDKISFRIFKTVQKGVVLIDGSTVQDGSINLSKLSAAVQNSINNIDTLAGASGNNEKLNKTTYDIHASNTTTAHGIDTLNTIINSHKADYLKHGITGTTDNTGTSTAYTLTPDPALSAYATGLRVTVFFDKTNTGAVTLNISGLGAIPWQKQSGADYAAGEILVNAPYTGIYNGASFLADSSGGLDDFFGDGSDGILDTTAPLLYNPIGGTAPSGGIIGNLYDGNDATYLTTNSITADTQAVIFTLDFGINIALSSIKLKSIFGPSSSISSYSLDSSLDGSNWTNRVNGAAPFPTSPGGFYNINTGKISARYLRFQIGPTHPVGVYSIGGFEAYYKEIIIPVTPHSGIAIKQYSSINIGAGDSLTVDNPCQGLILYSQGDVTINGGIDMSQKAGLTSNGSIIPMLITKKAYKTAKTSSLLHFNGSSIDSSGRAWTGYGSPSGPTYDTTNKVFGSAAMLFNGVNQYIDSSAGATLSYGSDDFTIDFWMRSTANTLQYLFGSANSNGKYGSISVVKNTVNKLLLSYWKQGDLESTDVSSATVLSTNTWYHIAIVKSNATLTLYLNGTPEVIANLQGVVIQSCVNKFAIGRNGEYASGYFSGLIDEFRIINGKAMWTTNFTPPTSEYTYQATYIDEPKALEKYYQLTTVLQALRGGYGGNGGYGGGQSGTARSTGGTGGAGRLNLGGFGGGGGGGRAASIPGGNGGSIVYPEMCADYQTDSVPNSYSSSQSVAPNAYYGGGAPGGSSCYANDLTIKSGKGGRCRGGGGGGSGGVRYTTYATGTDGLDGQYAGGLIMIIAAGNVSGTGAVKSNGGGGGAGSAAYNNDDGNPSSGGGGGGGSGGGVIGIFHKGIYTPLTLVQANGGPGGSPGPGGYNGEYGGIGTSGSVGTIHIQQL